MSDFEVTPAGIYINFGSADNISRQAALDALGEEPLVWHEDDAGEVAERNQWRRDVAAIKALPSAQPECEDAVSRFEVLRLIDYSSHDLNDAVDNRYMQNEIKQLPSVTPKQPGWISVTERLPEDNEEVLFCDNKGERWLGWHYGFWKTERLDFDEDDVVAWMPLPKPWEGDKNE